MASAAFSPDLDLLISVGRTSFAGSAQARTVSLESPDWPALPALAERHGMSAWAADALRERASVPDRVREAVQITARAQAARALGAAAELASLVERLESSGIQPVALKGPLFSQWLHGDMARRRFADLDLLISRADRVRATEVLRALGYRLPEGMTPGVAKRIYRGTGAWPLVHSGKIPLDLHWLSQGSRFGLLLDPREVFRESTTVVAGGVRIRIPGPTHAATLAVVHAAKHLWISLELLLSIARLLGRDDVDWMKVRALASRAHAWNGAAAGLALAAELFERELPMELRGLPLPPQAVALQSQARRFLALSDVSDTPRFAEWRAHRAALDTTASRVRYSVARLIEPTPLDWQWCALPDALAPLYYGVRLARLSASGIRLMGVQRKNALAPR